jgi:hypothetical protein
MESTRVDPALPAYTYYTRVRGAVKNTPAYCGTKLVTAVKIFIKHAPQITNSVM